MAKHAFADFEKVDRRKGTSSGGVYRGPGGDKWYIKYPDSDRQGGNEVMASRLYRSMGFDALEYEWVDNGMVASRWREDLPQRSEPGDLRENEEVQEAFLPSALMANWDVIGLVYDNCLYDPETMDRPVFLDFGGAFDTRAMGGSKQYSPTSIPALEGFTDQTINESAYMVFQGMTPDLFERSKRRIADLTVADIRESVGGADLNSPVERLETVLSRVDILMETEYEDVF